MVFNVCPGGEELAVVESMEVDPPELHLTAEKIACHAGDFSAAHRAAHWRASQAVLGSGLSAAGLPDMLGAWESDGARFAERFTGHADGHRAAANAYAQADDGGAERIGDAGSAL
jgi:hypothetical protein